MSLTEITLMSSVLIAVGMKSEKPLKSFQKCPQIKIVLLMWQISHFGSKECEPTNSVHS